MLGRTLVRQEGADLLDTVSATRLVRAVATYFHLANVAERGAAGLN